MKIEHPSRTYELRLADELAVSRFHSLNLRMDSVIFSDQRHTLRDALGGLNRHRLVSIERRTPKGCSHPATAYTELARFGLECTRDAAFTWLATIVPTRNAIATNVSAHGPALPQYLH